jgi:glycosyltransferase involved in cell wall biosynthesis
VRCLGPLYDSDILNGLYRNCRTYIHGHEVGGTNPSLLRAMGMGAACVAMDVVFNREVVDDAGRFFTREPGQLGGIIEALEADDAARVELGARARERTRLRYRWDAVAAGYAEFFTHIVEARRAGVRIPDRAAPDVYRPEAFHNDEPQRPGAAGTAGSGGASVPAGSGT